MQGITYSPYRQMGACPSPEQVDEDIRLIWSLTTRVRLYSTECRVVMEKLLTSGLQVLIGAWIDNAANDQKEVDDLVGLLREFPEANIYGIAIGNEPLLRQTMTPDQVANYLDDARYKVLGSNVVCCCIGLLVDGLKEFSYFTKRQMSLVLQSRRH